MIARVIIDTLGATGDQFYDYLIPEELKNEVLPGKRVLVCFGRGNRLVPALVMETCETSEYGHDRLKPIVEMADDEVIVQPYLIETIKYMRDNYFCTYVDALHCVIPSMEQLLRKETYEFLKRGEVSKDEKEVLDLIEKRMDAATDSYVMKKTGLKRDSLNKIIRKLEEKELIGKEVSYSSREEKKTEYLMLSDLGRDEENTDRLLRKNAVKQRRILEALSKGPVSYDEIRKMTNADRASVNRLLELGLVKRFYAEDSEDIELELIGKKEKLELTDEQKKVLSGYEREDSLRKFLLHGVTGSGKTEVYKRMFKREIENGRQSLFLVPEIALTPQMMRNIYREFDGRVAIMHSRLTPSKRIREWEKVRSGRADVVLGARSALFMPFKNLGLIVIDEEHENSYKSGMTPRYDTIRVANFISDITGAKLVLGSATPNVESYYGVFRGDYRLLQMKKRTNNKKFPPVQLVDMTEELKSGNRTPISRPLQKMIRERLERGEQTILFLNRRGKNTYVFCRQCGYTEECPNCSVSLTLHNSGMLRCHYCGYKRMPHRTCPECGSTKIRMAGTGTQKIESHVRKLFPDAGVIRMDYDTTRKVGSMERILTDFRKQKADILIGTQMVVKGHDFPNVTLVGILLADAALNFPDINAAQRTFQLCTQASGRAGRAEKEGAVVMQTYVPRNRTIVYSALQDYRKFYSYDIQYRMKMNYPPFTEILGIFIANEDERKASVHAEELHVKLKEMLDEKNAEDVTLYQPMDAFIHKLKNKYIVHVLLRYNINDDIKSEIRKVFSSFKKKVDSNVFAEINPVTLL